MTSCRITSKYLFSGSGDALLDGDPDDGIVGACGEGDTALPLSLGAGSAMFVGCASPMFDWGW